jgi:hypothetical protein
MDLDALVGRRVRLDYRVGALGPEALGIVQTSPQSPSPRNVPAAPVGIGAARGANLPVVPAPPAQRGPRANAAPAAQAWRCKTDLHQGDVGTIELRRRGTDISGVITIERGNQRHRLAGSWQEQRIEFTRQLSESSSQPFIGVAVESGNAVRMAGRFANRYSGVWSADCERIP